MVCVGGPVAGRRLTASRWATHVSIRDPATGQPATYMPMAFMPNTHQQFRVLVPSGTSAAQAIEWLIEGYKQERELDAAEFWGPELEVVPRLR